MNACSITHLKIVSYKIPYIIYSLCSPIEKGKKKNKDAFGAGYNKKCIGYEQMLNM